MVEKNIPSELEKAKVSGENLLIPSIDIMGLSEWHAPVVERVQLSSNPQDGDVYPHDTDEEGPGKKFRLTAQALNKISMCAGIIWPPEENKVLNLGRDYVSYQAVGGLRKPDGTPIFYKAMYDLDLEVVEMELIEQYERKAKWKKEKDFKTGKERPATDQEKAAYVAFCVKRDLLQKRKFKVSLCETGAKDRVIRKLLGLKNTYTAKELERPFVTARIVFRPDYNDPVVKAKMIDAAIQSITGVYGPRQVSESIKNIKPEEIIDLGEEALQVEMAPPNPGPALEAVNRETGEVKQPPRAFPKNLNEFKSLSDESQQAVLEAMGAAKKYDIAAYLEKAKKISILDLSPLKREGLFAHIQSLTDRTEDDIPF